MALKGPHETYVDTSDADCKNYRIFMVNCPALPNASLCLLDSACKMVHPRAEANYEPEDGRVGFVFPAIEDYKHPPVEQLQCRLTELCRQIGGAVRQQPGSAQYALYPLNPSHHAANFDPSYFLWCLTLDYARQRRIVETTTDEVLTTHTILWERLPEQERCNFTCYYQLPGHEGALFTDEQMQPLLGALNESRERQHQPLLMPESLLHHIEMNAPMVSLLHQSITPSRAQRILN